ncbi:MAG: ABC transporter permease, partial [Cyclobacteriaceae bacterium]|nr:ABC transporter permease [Cyclobacteriaceae bacterium]
LLNINGITEVSAATNIPGIQFNQNAIFTNEDPRVEVSASEVMVDYYYLKALGIPLLAGRFFSKDNPADSGNTFVINNTAARALGWKDPVGKEIIWDKEGGVIKGTVIGITEDFHYQSLHAPIHPLIMSLGNQFNHLIIKKEESNSLNMIADIERTIRQFAPFEGEEHHYLTDQIRNQYSNERRLALVFILFSLLTILLSCVGLFGMTSLYYQWKMKEIGIRKTLGAGNFQILFVLGKDIFRVIMAASLTALPLCWVIMGDWLNNFLYRITLNVSVLGASMLVTVAVALLTILYFAIKSVYINPVEVLKQE